MAWRLMLALLFMTAAVPAYAQPQTEGRTGLSAETEGRLGTASGDLIWNLVGLLGLIGLIGLMPQHEEDSYHPSSFDE
jgi:hypothetical protein